MISGLVVYLTADNDLAEATRYVIAEQPSIEVGVQEELRLPIVLETLTSKESQELTDWLNGLPGVQHVDVVFVHLEISQVDVSVPPLNANNNQSELRI
jgi:nitrate reductase NapAB chaperone NapD